MTPALSGALMMLRAGYCVQPCRIEINPATGSKEPKGLPHGWSTFGQSEADVVRAFSRDANGYMVACGPSGIVVADIDCKNGAQGFRTWGRRPAGGFTVRTVSGGLHHYFTNDQNIGSSKGADTGLDGVDIRGHGGGVFGPGSLNGAWRIERNGALTPWSSVGLVIPDSPSRATKGLDASLSPSVTPARAQEITTGHLRAVYEHAGRWAGEGFRHTLIKAAFTIGGYVGAELLSHDDAAGKLADAIRAAGYQPDDDDLLWIEQGLTDGSAHPLVVRAPFVSEVRPSSSGINLPREFWGARRLLGHCQQAAHARGRSADAVLGALLARLSSLVPGNLRVDSGIGTPASLNMFSILMGPSGTGKTTAAAIAEQLLPLGVELDSAQHVLGSGQGIASAYGALNGDGCFEQTMHRAMFSSDEGAALFALARSRENTTLATLRTAWTGQPFGQKNATAALDRRVADYALGLWIGLQPSHAAELFGATATDDGTLQRFIWFSATDPSIPAQRVAYPGRMDWDHSVLRLTDPTPLSLPAEIRDALYVRNVAVQRGELVPEPGQEHAPLHQIKLSGLLAMLDGRRAISAEDWQLAEVIMATSNAVAQSVKDTAAARAAEVTERRIAARHRQLDADDAREDKKTEAAVLSVVTKVRARPGMSRTNMVKSFRDRQLADTALTLAEERGLVRLEVSTTGKGSMVYPT